MNGIFRSIGNAISDSSDNHSNRRRYTRRSSDNYIEDPEVARQRALEEEQRAMRIAELSAAAERPGFIIELGVGYELFIDFMAHIGVGYSFNRYFSLYLDAAYAGIFYPENAVRAAITPKLTIHRDRFVFSLGAGIGMFWVNYSDQSAIFVLVRPAFEFDWYVGNHAFVGFGVSSPVFFETSPDVMSYDNYMFEWGGVQAELYFHFGFKI